MTALKLCSLALLALCALPLAAQETDPIAKIAPGKWALAYQRSGEFKPLHIKRSEIGTSYTCIDGDARTKIVDWIKSKGCTIDKEAATDAAYRLEGQCRLKWWKSHAIPVSIELRHGTRTQFTLIIRTRDDSLLGFSEFNL